MNATMCPTASGGLDTESALRRLAGNTKLYAKLLGQFQGTYPGAADEIAAYLAAGDLPTAERTSHTIKGLAGTLGAARLQAASAELERLCRAGDDASRAQTLEIFRAELKNALADIAAFLAAANVAPPSPQAAPAAPRAELSAEKLAALSALLAEGDTDAGALYKELRPAIMQKHPGIVAALDRSIEGFDFGQALSLIQAVFKN
jgi:HPt (histidine-containing phosphotransfer) domain-containing protein